MIVAFWAMRYNEKHGHYPLMRPKATKSADVDEESVEMSQQPAGSEPKGVLITGAQCAEHEEMIAHFLA